MSDLWRRNKAWEDEHLVGVLLPIKWVLRVFSSITLAVVLLSCVALYGIAASVPIGLLALAPTWLVYALVLLVLAACMILPPLWWVRRAMAGRGRPARFLVMFVTGVVGASASAAIWVVMVWPLLHYDPRTGRGLRLWADFVEQYSATTLRRLPMMEMSELEFYGWWPLRLVLLLFVVNMVVATVRRIEMRWRNIGVLTVHAGIILIALGGTYYSGLKVEGQMRLLAGQIDPESKTPLTGPPQDVFYDNMRVALYVRETHPQTGPTAFEMRQLTGVPRYNSYGLSRTDAAWASVVARWAPSSTDAGLSLDEPVELSPSDVAAKDVSIRLVGYSPYAEPMRDWVRAEAKAGERVNPLRFIGMHRFITGEDPSAEQRPIQMYVIPPRSPSQRISDNGLLAVEYTLGAEGGMTDRRWRDLTEQLPPDSQYGLVVEPAGGERVVRKGQEGDEFTVSGFKVRVKQLLPKPPLNIITPGYEGATSSVAIVDVTTPAGETFERYIYHRFPELNQDLAGTKEDGRPNRRAADPMIHIGLIDSSRMQIYLDEPRPGALRAVAREPGGELRVSESVAPGERFVFLDEMGTGDGQQLRASLSVPERWEHSVEVERPRPVPPEKQEPELIGTHGRAMLAVELSTGTFKRIMWLPFTQFFSEDPDAQRKATLPDGRVITLAFGRVQHQLPGFHVQLVRFDMISYDHRGSPRDYQSILRVSPTTATFDAFEHVTKLNEPLTAPWRWDEERSWLTNVGGRLSAGLRPTQLKFSQAGWDPETWRETQAMADRGEIARPYAMVTYLGVGNNPGIHVIALGSVLMGLGIPWAFYVKPWLVRREKLRIQQQVREGTYVKPERAREVAVVGQ